MRGMIEAAVARKLAFSTVALVLVLFATGCAAGSAQQGSLASHGVDYIPAFEAPYSGSG